jgi:hypothetical protein
MNRNDRFPGGRSFRLETKKEQAERWREIEGGGWGVGSDFKAWDVFYPCLVCNPRSTLTEGKSGPKGNSDQLGAMTQVYNPSYLRGSRFKASQGKKLARSPCRQKSWM